MVQIHTSSQQARQHAVSLDPKQELIYVKSQCRMFLNMCLSRFEIPRHRDRAQTPPHSRVHGSPPCVRTHVDLLAHAFGPGIQVRGGTGAKAQPETFFFWGLASAFWVKLERGLANARPKAYSNPKLRYFKKPGFFLKNRSFFT